MRLLGLGAVEGLVILLPLVLYIAGVVFTVDCFSDLAKRKGCDKLVPRIWVLAILATPIVAALYVIAMPDLSDETS